MQFVFTDVCRPHAFCPTIEGKLMTYYCGYGFYNDKRGEDFYNFASFDELV